MRDAALLAVALGVNTVAFAWLALSLPSHWQQVFPHRAHPPRACMILRRLGAAGIVAALLLCLAADHPAMAALVWMMSLTVTAFIVAFTLSWRPRLLAAFAIVPRSR